MKLYGGVEMKLHSFLTLALGGHEKTSFRLRSFYPQENNHRYAHRIRAGPSADLGILEARKFSFRFQESNCHFSVAQALS
jgi:hypothetical protein